MTLFSTVFGRNKHNIHSAINDVVHAIHTTRDSLKFSLHYIMCAIVNVYTPLKHDILIEPYNLGR